MLIFLTSIHRLRFTNKRQVAFPAQTAKVNYKLLSRYQYTTATNLRQESWSELGFEFDKYSAQVPKKHGLSDIHSPQSLLVSLKYDTATSCVMRKYTSWQSATMSLRNERTNHNFCNRTKQRLCVSKGLLKQFPTFQILHNEHAIDSYSSANIIKIIHQRG